MRTGRKLSITTIDNAIDQATLWQAKFLTGQDRRCGMSRSELENCVWMLAVEVQRLRNLLGPKALEDSVFDEDVAVEKWIGTGWTPTIPGW